MRRVWILSLVGVLGCGGAEMEPGASGTSSGEDTRHAESLVGSEGETNVAEGEDGPHPRRIIYTANVDLVVEDFEGVPRQVTELAERFEGYVASSTLHGEPGAPRRGTWTIRVPVEDYSKLLAQARELGELRALTSNSRDVSEEYYDVEARIRNKQKTESRLVTLLEEATGNLEQVLEVEEKLDRVREEIERMQGRLRVLEDQTSLATVTVTIEQIRGYEAEEEPDFGTRVQRAFRGSLAALVNTAENVLIVVVAASPWLAVLAVFALIISLIAWLSRRGG